MYMYGPGSRSCRLGTLVVAGITLGTLAGCLSVREIVTVGEDGGRPDSAVEPDGNLPDGMSPLAPDSTVAKPDASVAKPDATLVEPNTNPEDLRTFCHSDAGAGAKQCPVPGDGRCTDYENSFDEPGVCPRTFKLLDGSASSLVISGDGRFVIMFVESEQRSFLYDLREGSREKLLGKAYAGYETRISEDGNLICYDSRLADIVPRDTNGCSDVFCLDVRTQETERVSVSNSGAQAAGCSDIRTLSPSGRYVVFWSNAHNLVEGVESAALYVRDRLEGTTVFVDEIKRDRLEPAISYDERALYYEASSEHDWYEFGLETRAITALPEGYEPVGYRQTDRQGRLRPFTTDEAAITEDTNTVNDVYLEDLSSGALRRLSVDADGLEVAHSSDRPVISADGRFVVLRSYANLAGDGKKDLGVYVTYVGDLFSKP